MGNPRGFSCRRCRSLASVIGLRSMSSSGPIQLPQAQAKSTSQALPQQKPLSLPTQSKGIDSTSSNGSKEDGKPDVKDTPSVPPSITEQTLSSMHGIVPTLQNIVATVNLEARLDLKTIALHARNAEYNPKVRRPHGRDAGLTSALCRSYYAYS